MKKVSSKDVAAPGDKHASLWTRIARSKHPSFMLAAYPSRDTAMRLAQYVKSIGIQAAEVYPPLEYHTTIRYWKAPGTAHIIPRIVRRLNLRQAYFKPMTCGVCRLDNFGDDGCLVVRLVSKKLEQTFDRLDLELQGMGIPASDYPVYSPHITLAKGVTHTDYPPPDFPIELNRWALVDNTEAVYWEQDCGAAHWQLFLVDVGLAV